MAEHAIGTECPACKSLVACAGKLDDEFLSNRCGCCGATVTVANWRKKDGAAAVLPQAEPLPVPKPVFVERDPTFVPDTSSVQNEEPSDAQLT